MKRTLALLLAVMMVVSVFAGCSNKGNTETTAATAATEATAAADATYTYKDSVSLLCANWNPHTYQTNDDDYLTEFIRAGLYTFIFNDELNPVEDTEGNVKEAYTGYKIVPEMAADMPVDVTEQVKAEHPEFGIPESATSGYAYTIDLNPDACWEDGTPITADDYVESMKRLLDPEMLNYRASDYYAQSLCIAGAQAYANQGNTSYDGALGMTVDEYVANGGDVNDLYVDLEGFWGLTTADGKSFASINDDTMIRDEAVEEGQDEDYVSAKYLYENYLQNGAVYEGYQSEYLGTATEYPDGVSFDTVGLYKSGDNQITMVLSKSLAGFNLYYSLTSNWLVKTDLYDSCLNKDQKTSTYNTSVETTSSYGPYKLVSFQSGKALRLEKNENWYGWNDGKHVYVDPTDGQTYQMYQTTAIDCQQIEESSTTKMMFLKGELMGYGLTADDFATYRNSEFCHRTPKETLFFLILNGNKSVLDEREAAADFDATTKDLQTMTLESFRKAVAVTYDKELFASTISPARSGGYGIIGNTYIYNPETGDTYRGTEQAKQVLCDFYSVDTSKYANLDEAVASITGYDPEAAKELFTEAFNEALEAGYITDNDGDGVSDQVVTIEYCMSADSDFMTKTIDYLNEKMSEVTDGTPFAGKVQFVKSAPYGNDWSNKIKSGLSDTVLAGWTGSKLNPFSLSDLYVNPSYQYDAGWFDSTSVDLTLTIDGQELTMNLRQWSDALNGATVTVNGIDYNFGEGVADVETRLTILAGIEGEVLKTYDYLPMLQDSSMALLSQQVYYVTEDYNPVLGYGGLAYTKYNYTDAEWTAYVAEQGGELTY